MTLVPGLLSALFSFLVASGQPAKGPSPAMPSKAATPTSGSLPGTPSTAALRSDVERVQREAGKRKSFTVTFEQEFFSSLRKRTRRSSGSLAFLAPRNFRWEIVTPSKELYVNNGKEFWKYTEATRHAQKLPASSVELDFVDLVLRLDSLTQRYDVAPWVASAAKAPGQDAGRGGGDAARKSGGDRPAASSEDPPPAGDGMLLLALTPKQEGNQEKIFLRVDGKKAEVRELRIVYRNGNRTRIAFEALKEGAVEASRFDFTPPPGTAVDAIK